jgi:CRP/FNR family transcriptional regulator, cyclic AMP receptor protein
MVNMSELSGYVASTLVLLTFMSRDMRLLRILAILSNIAFIIYGVLEWLPPVLILHAVLLPLNFVRLEELLRTRHDEGRLRKGASIDPVVHSGGDISW